MSDRFHLFKRRYRKPDGKEYFYWWYWRNANGVRKQAPAGRACELKRDALAFVEQLEAQEARSAETERAPRVARFHDVAIALIAGGLGLGIGHGIPHKKV